MLKSYGSSVIKNSASYPSKWKRVCAYFFPSALQQLFGVRDTTLEDWTKKRNEGFLISLATAIKKEPTTSIRKDANELNVHKKTPFITLYGAF